MQLTSDSTIIFDTAPHIHPPTSSYIGYKKSTVFSQWQRQLQLQHYEPACFWTAEADASGWHEDLWEKLIIFSSKHVHVHSPTLPTIIARNVAYYRYYIRTHNILSGGDKYSVQPRNCIELRQHLCQVVGLVSLSPKGPVYTLPKVNTAQVDESKLVVGIHTWILPHKTSGDSSAVIRILSTILWNLEQNDTPMIMYWLSVLLTYDKTQRLLKQPIRMTTRQPLPPTNTNLSIQVDGKNAEDWVWLLWLALDTAGVYYKRPKKCQSALRDLSYLFAYDYKTSRRAKRIPLIIHAMYLVRTDTLDWEQSVYPNDTAKKLIIKACSNINVMYAEVQRRQKHEKALAAKARTNEVNIQSIVSTDVAKNENNPSVSLSVAPKSNHETHSEQKTKKGGMSKNSKDKMDIVDKIDSHVFFF